MKDIDKSAEISRAKDAKGREGKPQDENNIKHQGKKNDKVSLLIR
jgi:hypothetical protein